MPLLSLIIALAEISNKNIEKKLYLPDLENTSLDQKSFLAFLNKEKFLDCFMTFKIQVCVPTNLENTFRLLNNDDRLILQEFERYLSYKDCSILEAKVVNLSNANILNIGVEQYIDNELNKIRHRFIAKMQASTEKETFNKVALFLKETIENVFEHAYDVNTDQKFVGYYVRHRIGLADNSLDISSREKLNEIITKEHINSPRLQKKFLDNIFNFIEIFVIDAGKGITKNYFKYRKSDHPLFHEAWRDTIGLGLRGSKSPKKNTEFGGFIRSTDFV